ncbi:MAG TPA: HAD-IC family P-type ATPase, partial [Desulfuromonadaceae bacterium]|nr:HAD-IC family P-type ATPase [Desulfuromonadaceae bacterium]
ALEKAGRVTAILFDKTGTLTTGKLEVVNYVAVDPGKDTDPKPADAKILLLATTTLASALARHSTHPVSLAIADLPSDEFQMKEWREIPGSGVEAQVLTNAGQWKTVRLGSPRWLADLSIDLSPGNKFTADHSMQGAMIVTMAIDNYLVGLFALRDAIKPNAANVVQQLQQQGLQTFLVTGDNVAAALNLAKRVGITGKNVFAEIRPEQKASLVKELQAKGDRVAFVGDGINDAPALTRADLGIAVSRASDVARDAADIVLLKSDIEAVPEALDLARATLRTIKQNLFWAFFYNAIGIPFAALGFISPIFCAAAMGVSDLVVIGNALRLLKPKPLKISPGHSNS